MEKKDQLYNSEIKEKYLEEYENNSSRLISMYPLKRAKAIEERLNKDLYEMNLEELSDVLSSFSSSTENAVLSNVTKIEEYIMWAARNGYRKSNMSPFPKGDRKGFIKQFIATYRRYAFTREDILKMVDNLANEVDKAVLLLIFEGVRGTKYSELLNLKLDDLECKGESYYLNLTDHDGTPRTIKISDELANTLKRANKQYEYASKNGEIQDSQYMYTEFAESEYIFKRTRRGRQGGRLDNFFVNRKLILFKDVFNHDFLKAQHISSSGMMHMAHEAHEKNGVFTADDARAIADQFDTPYTTAGGQKYRNITRIRKVVESKDFIDLYGYKLNIGF